MYCKKNILRYSTFCSLILSLLILFSACYKEVEIKFQKHHPESEIKLKDLLNSVPAFRSAFSNIDLRKFNDELAAFLNYDTETSVILLNRLSYLMKENPSIPLLLDDVSGILKIVLDYYTQDENLEELDRLGESLEKMSEKSVRELIHHTKYVLKDVVSKLLFKIGSDSILYSSAENRPFQSQDIWANCDITNKEFKSIFPSIEEERETLYKIYELSRCLFCSIQEYATEKNIDRLYEIDIDNLDIVMLLEMTKEMNIEEVITDVINFLEDREMVKEIDEALAQWLVTDPIKVGLIDYLINYLYPLLFKTELYKDGVSILDKWAAFLTQKNPDATGMENEYLLEWLVQSLFSDLDKLSDLKNHTPIIINNPFYNYIKNELIYNTEYGAESVFNNEHGYHFNNLKRKLWTGDTFTSATGESTTFKGMFKNAPGLATNDQGGLFRVANYTLPAAETNFDQRFRLDMIQSNGRTLLDIPRSYANESPLQSFIQDYYYYLVDQFYSVESDQWVFDREDTKIIHGEYSSKNLTDHLARLQYSLLNLFLLNGEGGFSFDRDYRKIPFMSYFLYSLSGSFGVLDSKEGPAVQTHRSALLTTGENDISRDGFKRVRRKGQTVVTATFCYRRQYDADDPYLVTSTTPLLNKSGGDSACQFLSWTTFRNGNPYLLVEDMPLYELLTPGVFHSRRLIGGQQTYEINSPAPRPESFYTPNLLKGKFSIHQGDIISNGARMADWVMGQFQFIGWQGYGPYTYKGKAPNGGKLKYKSTFYTDSYKASFCKGGGWGIGKFPSSHAGRCINDRNYFIPMGASGERDAFSRAGDRRDRALRYPNSTFLSTANEGVFKMYENIYRPMKLSDHCWGHAGGGNHGYTLYAYLRPSKDRRYRNSSHCASWTRIKVDFDTKEEAILANLEWLIHYKKFVVIIPNYILGNKKVGANFYGTTMASFTITIGNGVSGLISAKLADSEDGKSAAYKNNGRWNNDSSYPMLEMNDLGVIRGCNKSEECNVNGKRGFVRLPESEYKNATGMDIMLLSTFYRTSFEKSDSSITVDMTGHKWGSGVPNVETETMNGIGRPTQDFQKALSPLLSLVSSFTKREILTNPNNATSLRQDILKFIPFFKLYLGQDIYNANGQPGPDGTIDVIQRYNRSIIYPGCKNEVGKTISYCTTAKDMPYIPRVNGVSYPSNYDQETGRIMEWSTYTGRSEKKFSAFVSLFTQMMRTFHSGGDIVKCNGNIARQENVDDICIKYFKKHGYRKYLGDFLEAFVSLNESKQAIDSSGEILLQPEYNSNAMLNKLTETSPGARNGLIINALRSLHFSKLKSMVEETIFIVNDILKNIANNFSIIENNSGNNSIHSIDKLRYFLTQDVITEGVFDSNFLGNNGSTADPIEEMKNAIHYLRRFIQDRELNHALVLGPDKINAYLYESNSSFNIPFTSSELEFWIDFIKHILNKHDKYGNYNLEKILDFLGEEDLLLEVKNIFYDLDIDRASDLIDWLPSLIERLDKTLDTDIGTDLKNKILEPFLGDSLCSASPTMYYHDFDENGQYSAKMLYLSGQAYIVNSDAGQHCKLKDDFSYLDLKKYHLNIKYLATQLNNAIKEIQETDIDRFLGYIYDIEDIDQVIVDLKNELIDDLYELEFEEISIDLNENDLVDEEEFLDIDGDGNHSDFNPRDLLTYAKSKMQEYIVEEKKDVSEEGTRIVLKNTPKALLRLMDDLLNPYHPNCIESLEGANCDYISSKILKTQKTFADLIDFTPEELHSFRDFIAKFVYDEPEKRYTHLLSSSSEHLPVILKSFKGHYERIIQMTLHDYEVNGFLPYVTNVLKVDKEKYTTKDFLEDIKILLNSKVMREYETPDTFWWQFSDLIAGFGAYASSQRGIKWDNNNELANLLK